MRCAAIRPATARTPARTRRCGQPHVGWSAGRRVPRHRGQHELPPPQGGCAMKKPTPKQLQRRMFLKGAGGAVLALPFLESLCPAARARADGDAAQAVHRPQDVQHPAGQGVVPALHRQRLPAEGQQYSGSSKADGTTLLTQKLVSRQELHLGPARRLPDADRDLRHPRPGAESVPLEADADPRPRFPSLREPQLRRHARQLLVVHGGHAVRRRQHHRRADHRPGDGVFAQGLSDDARPPLSAHLAGRR